MLSARAGVTASAHQAGGHLPHGGRRFCFYFITLKAIQKRNKKEKKKEMKTKRKRNENETKTKRKQNEKETKTK